ncbi:MAG: hypothetical protein KAT70_03315, partial [Thermoplasmata archaeon]|nr:hypothetical protein [Thermoplasmata archaeon]
KLIQQIAGVDRKRGATNALALRKPGETISGGASNGLTSNGNGKTNGRVNGLVSDVGRVNGRGVINGNGLTNGFGRINGNGLTNGFGRTNGRTSGFGKINGMGLINGLGKINGNGLINGLGKINGRGLINGLGRTNGNGLINGLGRTNGNGLINGLGRTNGNGLINGLGLVNGMGLINGNGLINGIGQFYRPKRTSPVLAWAKGTTSMGIALVLIMVLPVLLTLLYTTTPLPGITVDGEFADWLDIREMADEVGDAPYSDLDLRSFKLFSEKDGLSFYARVNGTMFRTTENDTHMVVILLDGDGNQETGYLYNNIGADSMYTITGWDRRIRSSRLYTFNESQGQNAWSGFRTQGIKVKASSSGHELEMKVPTARLSNFISDRARVAFILMNETGVQDTSDAPVAMGKAPLVVETKALAPFSLNPGQVSIPLFSATASTRNMNTTVEGLNLFTLSPLGTLQNVKVYVDADGSDSLTAPDTHLGSEVTIENGEMNISLNTPVVMGADDTLSFLVLADIPISAAQGSAIGLSPSG